MSSNHRHSTTGKAMIAGDVDARIADLDARLKKLEGAAPMPVPVPSIGPAIPAGAKVLLLDRFDQPSLSSTIWNLPSKYHCCGTPLAKGGLVAGYGGRQHIEADGLHSDAIRDATGTYQVPIIDTQGKVSLSPTLGPKGIHVEAKITIPAAAGEWPAFWMFRGGSSADEIDITEVLANLVGTAPKATYDERYNRVHVHSDVDPAAFKDEWMLPSQAPLSAGPHVYGADWAPDRIEFYLDGAPNPKGPFTDVAKFPKGPLYLILNLGISNGQDWLGNRSADASTPPVSTMVTRHVAAWTLPA